MSVDPPRDAESKRALRALKHHFRMSLPGARFYLEQLPVTAPGWTLFETEDRDSFHGDVRYWVVRADGSVVTEDPLAELSRAYRSLEAVGPSPLASPEDLSWIAVALLERDARLFDERRYQQLSVAGPGSAWRALSDSYELTPPQLVRQGDAATLVFWVYTVGRGNSLGHYELHVSADYEVSVSVTWPQYERMPAGVQPLVDDWDARATPIIRGALKSGRGGLQGQTRWTDDERAQLERLREQARAAIAEADGHARPWLLVGYARSFYFFGLGRDYADALLELPPGHRAWADIHSLLDVTWEASDQASVEAYAHSLAEHQDNTFLTAESLFLYLREADRSRDWARAHELADEIAALRVGPPDDPQPIMGRVNVPIDDHHPDRMLRSETRVPHFCASALVGDELGRVCLDELFPHGSPTLIIGSASWCGPCREVVPQAIASARARGVRGVLISYDESVEQARAYRVEYGIEDWPTLIPRLDGGQPDVPGDLTLRSIPYMALVDAQGQVTIGPPWVDAETLDEL